MVKQSVPTLPVLIMFTKDPDVANGLVASAATQRNIKLVTVGLSDDVAAQSSQLQVIERLIADAMMEVRFSIFLLQFYLANCLIISVAVCGCV